MFAITVIPIKKGLSKEYLTYFSPNNIPLGSIVTVPIKFKRTEALVINIESVREIKSDLKNRDYQLKRITEVKGLSPFSQNFFEACQRMKTYCGGTLGSVIKTFLSSVFLENFHELKTPIINENGNLKLSDKTNSISILNSNTFYQNPSEANVVKHEKLIFQTGINDRLSWYRTLIREAFAKKQSVFICVPTRYDIEKLREELTKGIEQYVFSFHSELTKKILITTYNQAITETHPILIIGTGMFLSIPRFDIKTIILENESSESYKQISRPYIDIRSFAEILSSIENIKLIFSDTLLRPETLYRNDIKELGEISPPTFRLSQVDRQLIVDMKNEEENRKEKEFYVLSKITRDMINYAISHNESVFLFSVRKGLAPVTICSDCKNILLCPECSTPIVLYGTKQRTATKIVNTRIFMCNKCGKKETTEIRCPVCLSWNLTPIGIGTDRVYEEVKKLFPKANIIQLDKETTRTEKEAREAISSFSKTTGSILIGTEMTFSYLNTDVTHSAIISLDGLLSIPSFNITQKILHIIEKLNYITKRNLIIQTRLPENPILKYILSGNVLPLYRQDLNDRKIFGYPPFKRLIKITFSGTTNETEKARVFLDELLGNYEPQIFSAFIGKIKGQYITNTVIKIEPQEWPLPIDEKKYPNEKLAQSLSQLPSSFSINVDPEDLL